MTDQSLLTEDVRSLIGRTSEAMAVSLTPVLVRRAREVYFGRPGQLPAVGDEVEGIAITALETSSGQLNLPDVMPNNVLISNEWQFVRPLRAGDQLLAQSRLADISERFGGQFGYSLYFRTDVEFRDSGGELVARTSTTLMQYDARNARDANE